ncbi:PREDICTED: alpha-tectorin-like isoform X1 [Nicrophorus vespilloides]|uniref:Alpha-tectorin-like isoform X1 n=1 Tax=Nicrophorus vespilloides TaxID=110193 RepID=A0ABM1NJJ1_NICVS|nr:PREDICTED: alpha-tectorin-like isoform X1 [Nicrophorus vespilloides]
MKLLIVFACILLMVGSSTSFEYLPIFEVCGPNSHYTTCVLRCPKTCFWNDCVDECIGEGCECDEGYVQDRNGNCINKDDCLVLRELCGLNELFTSCGSGCSSPRYICGEPVGDPSTWPKYCPAVCVPRCYCKDGYLRNSKGKCVLPEVCE